MAKVAKTVSEVDAQIEILKARREELLSARENEIAKLVVKSGLAELDIKDADLRKALAEVAARFQGKLTKQKAASPRSTPQQTDDQNAAPQNI